MPEMTPREPLTGSCPTCGAPAGTCAESKRNFALYDVLDLAAAAVDEAASGRLAFADAAWLNAWMAAEGLFPAGSRLDAAIGVILAASRPGGGTGDPARLWHALNAAASAVLAAIGEDREEARARIVALVPSAVALAAALDWEAREALIAILGEARRIAAAGSGVPS